MIAKKLNPNLDDDPLSPQFDIDDFGEAAQIGRRSEANPLFPDGIVPYDHDPNESSATEFLLDHQKPILSSDFATSNKLASPEMALLEKRLDELLAGISSIASTLKLIIDSAPSLSSQAQSQANQTILMNPMAEDTKTMLEKAQKQAHNMTENAFKERDNRLQDGRDAAQTLTLAERLRETANRTLGRSENQTLSELPQKQIPDRHRVTLALQVATAIPVKHHELPEPQVPPAAVFPGDLPRKQASLNGREPPLQLSQRPQFAELPETSPSKSEAPEEETAPAQAPAPPPLAAAVATHLLSKPQDPAQPVLAYPASEVMNAGQGKKVLNPLNGQHTLPFASIPITLRFGRSGWPSKKGAFGPALLLLISLLLLGYYLFQHQDGKKFYTKYLSPSGQGQPSSIKRLLEKPSTTKALKGQAKTNNTSPAKHTQKILAKEPKGSAKFSPPQSSPFKRSYTDNVLFTGKYTATEWHTGYRNTWNINLRKFLIQELKMKPSQVTPFLQLETKLISDLKRMATGLRLDNKDQGILTMRSLEATTQKSLTSLLGSKANFDRFFNFKAKHFAKHQPRNW